MVRPLAEGTEQTGTLPAVSGAIVPASPRRGFGGGDCACPRRSGAVVAGRRGIIRPDLQLPAATGEGAATGDHPGPDVRRVPQGVSEPGAGHDRGWKALAHRSVQAGLIHHSDRGFTSRARATSPSELPRSSRWTAARLNSLVNILLDHPMTQFSFEWILSLIWLCQKWGQVQ